MNGDRIFPPTTERSSHIGLEGRGFEADWRHFLDKYRTACLRFARRCCPNRPDLAEDAFSNVVAKIVTNPTVVRRKPSVRFRSVLSTLLRNAVVDLIRRERPAARARYEQLTDAAHADRTTPDCDRRRRQLLAIDLIQQDLLREDYENGRFSREFNSLDLDIWRALQEDGETLASVARRMHLPVWKVHAASKRTSERIREEAAAFLAALGLM